MEKIFDFNTLMNNKSVGKLNENESYYAKPTMDFEHCVNALCDSFGFEISKHKKFTAYLGDYVNKLIAEIRSLPGDVFFRLYTECCDESESMVFFMNNSKEFVDEVEYRCESGDIKCQSVLYNKGSWNVNDKYAAFVYPEWSDHWITSFNDDNMPTENDDFMEYFVYIVIDMNDWDDRLRKFGFDYLLSFEENKRRVMSEYGYPESMIDLVHEMYCKYCEHYDLEVEMK